METKTRIRGIKRTLKELEFQERFPNDKLLTMRETMEYLVRRGVPCSSRKTFYRLIERFNIPYTNINPNGRYEIRRFAKSHLDNMLRELGIDP